MRCEWFSFDRWRHCILLNW